MKGQTYKYFVYLGEETTELVGMAKLQSKENINFLQIKKFNYKGHILNVITIHGAYFTT